MVLCSPYAAHQLRVKYKSCWAHCLLVPLTYCLCCSVFRVTLHNSIRNRLLWLPRLLRLLRFAALPFIVTLGEEDIWTSWFHNKSIWAFSAVVVDKIFYLVHCLCWPKSVAGSKQSRVKRNRVLVGTVASVKAGLALARHLALTRHRGIRACSSGKGANQQDVWNTESGSPDKMGGGSEMQTEQWKAEPHRIRFLIHELPRPSNLFCWGKVESPACHLCSGRGTH